MDDNMKKLIEKYKQELMAAAGNSHTSAAPKPAAALDFPEMLPEEPAASAPDSPTEESAAGRTPTVIAWSADSPQRRRSGSTSAPPRRNPPPTALRNPHRTIALTSVRT